MATESTAIVNLVDLVKNNRPMPKEAGDDLLFGGGGRFDPFAMPVQAQPVMLPPPPGRQPAYTPVDALEERTIRVPRSADPQATLRKFTLPVALFVVAMVLLSIYLAKAGKKAPTAAVVHAPAPMAKMPAIAPPPPPAPVVAPAAAPIAATANASAAVVTPIEDSKPTVEPIDPPTVAEAPQPTVPTVPDVPVAAADDAATAAPAAPVKAAKRHREHHRAAKRAKADTRVATADAPKPAKLEKLGGKAALVLASSPSREIWIDGRNTKQMTPQRLSLAPGTHNVTLFDKKTRSAKTFQVELKPNATTKVAKSY